MKRMPSDNTMRCSFCHKHHGAVGKLISTPSDYPRAYICDECVAVCQSIIEDDKQEQAKEPENYLENSLVPELLQALNAWVDRETRNENAAEELADVRRLAMQIFPYRVDG